MPSTTNFEIAILSEEIILATKSRCDVVWNLNLPRRKWDSPKNHFLEHRYVFFCRKCGSRSCSHSKAFFAVPKQRQCSNIEALQKTVEFYHNKSIDVLKLGCTLPNLANNCLNSSTSAKYLPFTENDKDLLSKARENMIGGPLGVFTRKAVVDETHIRKSTNVCKSIFGIDASKLYP